MVRTAKERWFAQLNWRPAQPYWFWHPACRPVPDLFSVSTRDAIPHRNAPVARISLSR